MLFFKISSFLSDFDFDLDESLSAIVSVLINEEAKIKGLKVTDYLFSLFGCIP
jgi:hypothetical protein